MQLQTFELQERTEVDEGGGFRRDRRCELGFLALGSKEEIDGLQLRAERLDGVVIDPHSTSERPYAIITGNAAELLGDHPQYDDVAAVVYLHLGYREVAA